MYFNLLQNVFIMSFISNQSLFSPFLIYSCKHPLRKVVSATILFLVRTKKIKSGVEKGIDKVQLFDVVLFMSDKYERLWAYLDNYCYWACWFDSSCWIRWLASRNATSRDIAFSSKLAARASVSLQNKSSSKIFIREFHL